MTKKAGIIQLSQNDGIRDLVKKCNSNFQVLGSSVYTQPISRQVTAERLEASINAVYASIDERTEQIYSDIDERTEQIYSDIERITSIESDSEWTWWKLSSGLVICRWEPIASPILEISSEAGSLYKSDDLEVVLPFSVLRGNAFGSFVGAAYDVKSYLSEDGTTLHVTAYNDVPVASVSANIYVTVVGHWK